MGSGETPSLGLLSPPHPHGLLDPALQVSPPGEILENRFGLTCHLFCSISYNQAAEKVYLKKKAFNKDFYIYLVFLFFFFKLKDNECAN